MNLKKARRAGNLSTNLLEEEEALETWSNATHEPRNHGISAKLHVRYNHKENVSITPESFLLLRQSMISHHQREIARLTAEIDQLFSQST